MTEKKYEDAIELILTPSFLTNYPQIIFTYKTKTLNQKTLKKRQYPLKNESIKYFKQKKTNPFIQVPLNENSQKTPKKSLVKVANMDFLKNNKGN